MMWCCTSSVPVQLLGGFSIDSPKIAIDVAWNRRERRAAGHRFLDASGGELEAALTHVHRGRLDAPGLC